MKKLIHALLAASALLTTTAAQSTRSIAPTADAKVFEGLPTENDGRADFLRVRSITDGSYRSFLRFDVPAVSGSVESAKLRLYCTDGSPTGGEVRVLPDSSWSETGITWENQPGLTTSPVTTIGAVATGSWVEVHLTGVIGGPGTYVVALAGGSTNSAYYSSREGAQPPQLVLGISGGSDPVVDFVGTPLTGAAPLQVVFEDLSPDGATSWLWSFGDGTTSRRRNPVHLYQAAGTYTVTLVASGGGLSLSATKEAYVRVFAGEQQGVWSSARELALLPTSGSSWSSLVNEANRSIGTPVIADQDDHADQTVLAKALVYARTGNETFRTQVILACRAAMGTEAGGRTLALGRNLAPYVIAADLVGLPADLDTPFRAWLRHCLTQTLDGMTLVSTHEDRPNNWGTHAGASRAAVAAYLGDTDELQRCAKVFKGWLGDRTAYAGFDWGDLSWQADPSRPVAINPRGATKDGHSIDGVLPDDQRRAGGFVWPPTKENYVWEALQGALVQAVILHRAGFDVWNWSDQALLRAVTWLHTECQFPATGDDTWQPHVINHFYASQFPAPVPANEGKNMGWTDWTHAR